MSSVAISRIVRTESDIEIALNAGSEDEEVIRQVSLPQD
jgi:hypothetical protein